MQLKLKKKLFLIFEVTQNAKTTENVMENLI